MSAPTVSVIVPAYNSAAYVAEAIESALAQTLTPAEIIVVDDGSIDGTGDIVRGYGPPVRLDSQENRGQASARNAGIAKATGAYIAFLDSDDVWLPDHLEATVRLLERSPGVGLAASRSVAIDEQGKIFRSTARERPLEGDALAELLTSTWLGSETSTVVIRRSALEVGLFDESLPPAEDWHLWVRIAARQHLGHTWRVTARYRVHAGGSSRHLARLEHQKLRAIDLLAQDPDLDRRVPGWRRKARAATFLVIARCHLTAGSRFEARRALAAMLAEDAASLLSVHALETFAATAIPMRLARGARAMKWRLEHVLARFLDL